MYISDEGEVETSTRVTFLKIPIESFTRVLSRIFLGGSLFLIFIQLLVALSIFEVRPSIQDFISNYFPGIAVSGLTFYFTSTVFKQYYEAINEENIRKTSNHFLGLSGMSTVKFYGVNNVYENLDKSLETLRKKLLKSKEVYILSTYLDETIFNYSELARAARNGCKEVKVLLLTPNEILGAQIIKIREKSLEDSTFTDTLSMSERIIIRAKELKSLEVKINRELKEKEIDNEIKINVKFYDTFPAFYLCMIDNLAVVGFYWNSIRATQNIMLEVKGKDTIFFKNLKREFDLLWKESLYEANEKGVIVKIQDKQEPDKEV